MRDNSGKIPMDYAESLPSSDTRSCAINALATAPILVATAKAAWARANLEWETRIAGIKEANAEYVRQMEEMHNLEKTSFLKMEIQFQNQLADEKEKNIALAESMIKQKTRAEELLAERNEARILLEKERAEFKFQSEEQDREISAIIQDSAGHPAGSKAENGRTYSLKEQLVEFATRYNETMAKKDVAEKDLTYNENMVKHLNQLLSNKDAEIEELTKMLKGKEESQQRSLSRLSKLTNLHNGMQRQLKSTKDELDRLQEHTSTLQQQLEQSNRILQIQESRFGNIKGLVHSLSYNIDSWAFDDQEWDQKTVVEGLETLKLKGANNGRNVPTTLEKADSDKSADTTNDTAAMDDEDISTLSPSPSPGRPSGRIKPV